MFRSRLLRRAAVTKPPPPVAPTAPPSKLVRDADDVITLLLSKIFPDRADVQSPLPSAADAQLPELPTISFEELQNDDLFLRAVFGGRHKTVDLCGAGDASAQERQLLIGVIRATGVFTVAEKPSLPGGAAVRVRAGVRELAASLQQRLLATPASLGRPVPVGQLRLSAPERQFVLRELGGNLTRVFRLFPRHFDMSSKRGVRYIGPLGDTTANTGSSPGDDKPAAPSVAAAGKDPSQPAAAAAALAAAQPTLAARMARLLRPFLMPLIPSDEFVDALAVRRRLVELVPDVAVSATTVDGSSASSPAALQVLVQRVFERGPTGFAFFVDVLRALSPEVMVAESRCSGVLVGVFVRALVSSATAINRKSGAADDFVDFDISMRLQFAETRGEPFEACVFRPPACSSAVAAIDASGDQLIPFDSFPVYAELLASSMSRDVDDDAGFVAAPLPSLPLAFGAGLGPDWINDEFGWLRRNPPLDEHSLAVTAGLEPFLAREAARCLPPGEWLPLQPEALLPFLAEPLRSAGLAANTLCGLLHSDDSRCFDVRVESRESDDAEQVLPSVSVKAVLRAPLPAFLARALDARGGDVAALSRSERVALREHLGGTFGAFSHHTDNGASCETAAPASPPRLVKFLCDEEFGVGLAVARDGTAALFVDPLGLLE